MRNQPVYFEVLKYVTFVSSTLFAIQLSAGMTAFNALIATIFIVVTSSAGGIVWLGFTYKSRPSLIELSGMGLVISTIAIALINLVYRTFNTGTPVATIAFVLSVGMYLIRSRKKSSKIIFSSNGFHALEVSLFGVITTGYLSALSTYFYPLFIAFVMLSVFNGMSYKWNNYFALSGSILIITVGVIITRYIQQIHNQTNPSWRWTSNDAIYDTSQSVGVGRFGLTDNIFSTGQYNKGYLLVYSWSGEFANTTRLPHLEIATISFAVVALFGICCCTIAICNNLQIPKLISFLICGSILFQSSFPEAHLGGELLKINNMITLLWLIGFLNLIIIAKIQNSTSLQIATYLAPPIIMFGKFHFGVLAIIMVLTATTLGDPVLRPNKRQKAMNWYHAAGSFCALILSFCVFKLFIEFPNRFPNRFTFDMQFFQWGIILFLFRFLGIRLLNFVDWFSLRRVINSLMFFSVCFYVLGSGANNSIYFVSGSFAVASFGIFAVLHKDGMQDLRNNLLPYFSLTAISAAVSYIAYADFTTSYFGFLASPSSGLKKVLYTNYIYLVQPILIAFFVPMILIWLTCFNRFKNQSRRKYFASFLVLTIFGSNLGFFLFLPIRPIILNQKYDANEYQIFPVNVEIVEALNFVRLNTQYKSVVVSNRLCNEEIGDENRTPDWPPGSFPSCGNLNLLSPVSAISERRQLLEAPAFNNVIGPFLDSDSLARYKLVLRFFGSPSDKDLTVLRLYSVSHVFIDKSQHWNVKVLDFGKVIFENQSAVVLQI